MPAIFISHSSLDQKISDDIRTSLAKLGFEQVFLDFDKDSGIGAGENWEKRLYEELSRCHAVILVLTPNWLASTWCRVELAQARALGKVILPVICAPLGDRYVLPEVQAVDLVDWKAGGLERLEQKLHAIADELARGFQLHPSRPPYPGFHSFEAEDAAIYFGRDNETRTVIEKLDARRAQGGARLLMIIGASGSGKSSLLRAGVLPQLNRRKRDWVTLPPIRPEKAPLEAVAKAIAEQTGRADNWRGWHDRLQRPDAANQVAELLKDLRIGESRAATVLLPIDQFEEVFTVSSVAERAAFIALIATTLDRERDLPLMIIATGRSDVLEALIQAGDLADLTETFPFPLMPLERVPRLIEGPASIAGINVEKGLPDRIARDVESAEALPLLAQMLWLLYRRGIPQKKLTLADYEALGDAQRGLNPIQNSVRLVADQAIEGLKPAEKERAALRDAFVPHLVRIRLEDGKRVRQAARMSELPQESLPLVRALVQARLLTTRASDEGAGLGEALVEVTHEALFKAWPELDRWLTQEHSYLIDLERVRDAHDVWSRADADDKPKAYLHGLQLARSRDWLIRYPQRFIGRDIEPLRAFIAESAAADDAARARTAAHEVRARRMQQWLVRGASAAAAVFAVLAFFALNAARDARRNLDLSINGMDALVSKISSELRDRIVSQDVIKRILAVIDAQFDELARAGGDNQRIKLSQAAMLSALVDNYIGLGDMDAAKTRAQACIDIARPVLISSPKDLQVVASLGQCFEKRGDVALWSSAFRDAAAAYQSSIDLRRRVLAANPDDTTAQLNLSHVLNYYGFSIVFSDVKSAIPVSIESLKMTARLTALDPNNPRWKRERMESLNLAAMALQYSNKQQGAISAYQKAGNLARSELKKDPGNATLQRFLSNLLDNLARDEGAIGEFSKAVDSLQDAIRMKRHLVDVDPENTVWQVEFIITLTALGDGQLALQKPNDALVSYMEANRSAQTLIKQDPKNSFWQQQLLYSDLGLIKAKHAQGDAQGARAAAQDALNVIAIIETLDLAQLGDNGAAVLKNVHDQIEAFLNSAPAGARRDRIPPMTPAPPKSP